MRTHTKSLITITSIVLATVIGAGQLSAQTSAAWQEAAKYDFGQSRTNLVAIEDQIRSTPPAQFPEIETKLLGLLQAGEATFAAKQFALRQLRQVGSAKCVGAVAPLLTDEKLSHMARYALQALPAPEVDDALRAALDKVSGNLKIGLVGSIAQRGDAKAVPQLAALITNNDKALAGAALTALGRIGGPAAMRALKGAAVSAELQNKRADAYLMCADKLVAQNDVEAARAIYRELYVKSNPAVVRVAALRGVTMTEQAAAVPVLIEALNDAEPKVQAASARFLAEVPGTDATKAIAGSVKNLPPVQQAIVVTQLGDRGDKEAAPEVAQLTNSSDLAVRVAALKALGTLGDFGSVPLLLAAASGNDDAAKAAADSLNKLNASGVDAALVNRLASETGPAKLVLVRALAARNYKPAVPALLAAADEKEAALRGDVYKAIGALVDEQNLPGLVQLLVKTDGSAEAEGALIDACRRIEPAKMEGPVLGALAKANQPATCALLRVAGQIGSAPALDAVRGAVNSSDEKIQDAAVRSLTTWSDASAEPDLLAIAKTGKKDTHKILALRGYVKLVGRDGQKDPKNAVTKLEAGMAVATRPDEKKMVIGALAELNSGLAFAALAPFIADDSLRNEAESAYLKTAESLKQKHKNEAIAGLKKFSEIGKTQAQLDRAHKLLAELGAKAPVKN